jgi:hypothetical protein
MTHCYLYTGKRCKDIVVLRLVQHHTHVRLVDFYDQSIFQKFDDAFLKLPHVSLGQKGPGSLLCWDFQEPSEDSVLETTDERYRRFALRSSFENPILCFHDSTGGNLAAEHAAQIRDELIRFARHDEAMFAAAKSKSKSPTPVTKTIHYATNCSNLMVELKTRYGIVGGRIQTSGNCSTASINEFRIKHKHVTFSIGNFVSTKMETMTEKGKQDATSSMKTLEDIQIFNKFYQPYYAKLLNRETISHYSSNFLYVVRMLRCSPLGFTTLLSTDEKKKTPAVDQNKAYSTLLCYDMKQFPVFDEGCEFVQYYGEADDDYTLYVIEAVEGYEYSVAQRLIMSKQTNLYYGIVLKRAIEAMGELPFWVRAKCSPVRIVNIDFSEDLKSLYEYKSPATVSAEEEETAVATTAATVAAKEAKKAAVRAAKAADTSMKKNIANCLLGCVDKWQVSRRQCEWFDNEGDANTMLGILPGGTRIEIPLMKGDGGGGGGGDRGGGVAAFEEATKAGSEELWIARHEEYAASIDNIYLNVISSEEHQFSEGFLPISLLKYQFQRLRVLRSWLSLEQSETLQPIGVKTDAVFVRRKDGKR